MPDQLEGRIAEMESRLSRLERLALLNYNQIRDLGKYTYELLKLDVHPDDIKRPLHLQAIQDHELVKAGATLEEVAVLKKFIARDFRFVTRLDMVDITNSFVSTPLEVVHGKSEEAA